MAEQLRRHDLLDALVATVREQAGAEAYERSQRQARRAMGDTPDRPRPLEFDENGYPVTQRRTSFAARVARLLNP